MIENQTQDIQAPVKMKPAARHVWIRDWIRQNGGADVLNSEFVSAYVKATGLSLIHI